MNEYDANSFVSDVIAAKILSVGVQSLRNWRHRRTGPPYCKRGTLVRYLVKDLLDYMCAGRIDPEAREG
jgi:hypothetical protein